MHGNTRLTENGFKTRRFDEILSELEQAFDLHAAAGSNLAACTRIDRGKRDGVHRGARGLDEKDLARDYRSEVIPA